MSHVSSSSGDGDGTQKFTTWDALIRDYRMKWLPEALKEQEWIKRQELLRLAIEVAAKALDGDMKRYSHQNRIKRDAIKDATEILLKAEVEIEKKGTSFDQLHANIEKTLAHVNGVSDLYIYDVSLRIAFWLDEHAPLNARGQDRLPKNVYLHAGTAKGAKELRLLVRNGTVEMSDLPSAALRRLPAWQVEDILCIYGGRFPKS
jgi:hypothetical protein